MIMEHGIKIHLCPSNTIFRTTVLCCLTPGKFHINKKCLSQFLSFAPRILLLYLFIVAHIKSYRLELWMNKSILKHTKEVAFQ